MTTAKATKERPILFSAPMIRVILAGHKTMTRRPVKGLGVYVDTEMTMGPPTLDDDGDWIWPDGTTARCPYGRAGDRLWVKETFSRRHGNVWRYDADNSDVNRWDDDEWMERFNEWVEERDGRGIVRATVSSIHMPRWASRITLEITGVKVERLQDITEADVEAEGCVGVRDNMWGWENWDGGPFESAREAFQWLWESIHGDDSWKLNPWLWCVSFKGQRLDA